MEFKFEEIKKMSKETWKQKVKEKCNESALIYLKSKIKSKLSQIDYQELKIQEYLLSDDISIRNKKLIFSLRSEMVSVSKNYGLIKLCKYCPEIDSQEHLIKCVKLEEVKPNTILNHNEIEYKDIFSNNVDKMKLLVEHFRRALEAREILEEKTDREKNSD